MCVAIPGRVISIGERTSTSMPGRVLTIEVEREVDLVMVPQVEIGDYVIVHSGYALQVVPPEQATETMNLLGLGIRDELR